MPFIRTTTHRRYEAFQIELGRFNQKRFIPNYFYENWQSKFEREGIYRRFEAEMIDEAMERVQPGLTGLPERPEEFITWLQDLNEKGPGQDDSLFPWLSKQATASQIRFFIRQEAFAETYLEECATHTNIGMPSGIRLHTLNFPFFSVLAKKFGISPDVPVFAECIALSNLMVGLAANRHYAFHSLGALAVNPYATYRRINAVCSGLERIGVQCVLPKESDWIRASILPLIEENPDLILPIAEGALMRLNAGTDCYKAFRKEWYQR